MPRPNTTNVDFLRGPAGKPFIDSIVARIGRNAAPPTFPVGDKKAAFQHLIDDFMNQLQNEPDVRQKYDHASLVQALDTTYRERFEDLYPKEEAAVVIFHLRLANLIGYFLEPLTANIWRLDNNLLPGFPHPRFRPCSALHLHWAREALGWWAAHLANLQYHLHQKAPCDKSAAVEVMAGYLTAEQLEVLKRTDPDEIEDGCPIC